MKIKASKVKPGMAIRRTIHGDGDISVVFSVHGKKKVEFAHFDFRDSYSGRMIGVMEGDEIVDVITGLERKTVLDKCFRDCCKALHDAEDNVRIIKLMREIDKYDKDEMENV